MFPKLNTSWNPLNSSTESGLISYSMFLEASLVNCFLKQVLSTASWSKSCHLFLEASSVTCFLKQVPSPVSWSKFRHLFLEASSVTCFLKQVPSPVCGCSSLLVLHFVYIVSQHFYLVWNKAETHTPAFNPYNNNYEHCGQWIQSTTCKTRAGRNRVMLPE